MQEGPGWEQEGAVWEEEGQHVLMACPSVNLMSIIVVQSLAVSEQEITKLKTQLKKLETSKAALEKKAKCKAKPTQRKCTQCPLLETKLAVQVGLVDNLNTQVTQLQKLLATQQQHAGPDFSGMASLMAAAHKPHQDGMYSLDTIKRIKDVLR